LTKNCLKKVEKYLLTTIRNLQCTTLKNIQQIAPFLTCKVLAIDSENSSVMNLNHGYKRQFPNLIQLSK